MGCCTGRCTLIFLCSLQLVSARPPAPGHAEASPGWGGGGGGGGGKRRALSPPRAHGAAVPRSAELSAPRASAGGPAPLPTARPLQPPGLGSFAARQEEEKKAAWGESGPRAEEGRGGGCRGASARAAALPTLPEGERLPRPGLSWRRPRSPPPVPGRGFPRLLEVGAEEKEGEDGAPLGRCPLRAGAAGPGPGAADRPCRGGGGAGGMRVCVREKHRHRRRRRFPFFCLPFFFFS